MKQSTTVAEWLADRGALPDASAKMIANDLRLLAGVDEYDFAVVPTYENGATPDNPGLPFNVQCVPDHIDKKVIAYVTMRLG